MSKPIKGTPKDLDKPLSGNPSEKDCTYLDGPDLEGRPLVIGEKIGSEPSDLLDWLG